MHTTDFIANGDIQTAFHDLEGPDSSAQTPLVLIHGFTGSKLDFADQLQWFTDLTRVIAYDQRGHGESSNQGPYTEAQFVADLISLLDALEIERCDLLGHSFGGMVAMRAALDHAQRFRSLILMDTSPGSLAIFKPQIKKSLDELVAEQGCEALVTSMRGAEPSAAARRGVEFLGESEHWRRITTKLAQMDPDAFSAIGDYFGARADLLPAFGSLTCPLTVIVGAEDTPFLAPSQAMAEAAADAVLNIIPYAAHSPQYENSEHWRDTIRAHLKRVRLN